MKRFFHRSLTLLLCVLLLLPISAFAQDLPAQLNVDSAVLRTGPGSDTAAVKFNGSGPEVTLQRGDAVTVIGNAEPGTNGDARSWYPVLFDYEGITHFGYLCSDQLRFTQGQDPGSQEPGMAAVAFEGTAAAAPGDTVYLTLSISSASPVGAWLFALTYDAGVLEYVSGADNAQSGRLLFCDARDGAAVIQYDLVFTALSAGETALTVASPQIVSYEGVELVTGDASFTVAVEEPHEHLWGETSYLWSVDYATCTATHSCAICLFSEQDVASSVSETRPATCLSPAFTVYTATFFEDLFEARSVTVTSGTALGHNYAAVATPPTCSAAGYTTYTCARCGDSYTVPGAPATAHTHGEVRYEWSEDLAACTAVCTCTVCGGDLSETVRTNSGVTRPATEEEDGVRTYTAAFTDPFYETQTRERAFSYTGVLWGDANGDGEISNKDVVRLKNYMANLDPETGVSTYVLKTPDADANGDGSYGNKDVVRLKNYLANLDPEAGVSTYVLGPAS